MTSPGVGGKLATLMRRWSVVLVVLGLVACGNKDAGDARPPPPSPPVEVRTPIPVGVDQLPQPKVELPRQISFRVLEPGAGERAVLRYQIAEAEITTKIDMSLTSRRMTGTTWSDAQTLPTIKTALATAGLPAGRLRARPLLGSVEGAATAETASYLAGWKASENRRLTAGFDPRGQLGPLVFNDDPTSARSEEARDDLTQRLLSITVPVPDEPVGIGARWRVVTVLTQRPVVVKQTATYTLRERAPAGWKIDVETQRVGEEQTIVDPAIGADAKVELVALVRRYQGTLVIDPAHALPTGTLAVESSMHLRVQPRTGPIGEQILEDKGTVVLAVDR